MRIRNLCKLSGPLRLAFQLLLLLLVLVARGGQARPKLATIDLYNLREHKSISTRSGEDDTKAPTCGYDACPETSPERLNVHLVAHSHDDVGWLKTVDQYYYETNNEYARVGVQHIYDSVIPQLVMDSSKRFIAVEMAFFIRWWSEQEEGMRTIVRRLVNEGRLEFINGGWCMNDEATTNYQSNIEQMTLGLRFLNETFGACARPKVGWQIDPFGHSSEQASMFAQFGFDGMFFSRASYEDKERRKSNKSLDLMWHADVAQAGQTGSIFTNIFRDTYDAPETFCFDVLCQEDNLVDNKKSYEYNIESRVEDFVRYLKLYAKTKEHNHLLIPMGGDFQYSSAGRNFKNMDKLIKHIRSSNYSQELNVFYSTPSCYQLAVHDWYRSATKRKIPEKYDDFMPYDSTPTVWWSGYFTSKPSIKLIERDTANLLQVSRFISLANLLRQPGASNSSAGNWINNVRLHESKCLLPLWEILGDLQHHDAVTGTAKDHVDRDYIRRVVDASNLCAKFIGDLRRQRINDFLKRSPNYESLRNSAKRLKLDPVYLEDTMFCNYLNISQCDPIEANVDPAKFAPLVQGAASSQRSANYQLVLQPSIGSDSTSTPAIGAKQLLLRHKHLSKVARSSETIPPELETKAVLVNVYNPLARPISQQDIRLPCAGQCNLAKVKVIHLSTNETMRLTRLPLPAGVVELPFRDALTCYEVLFYANIPALGYSSYVFEDLNKDEYIEEASESVQAPPAASNLDDQTGNRNEKRESGPFGGSDFELDSASSRASKAAPISCKPADDFPPETNVCDLMEINLNLNKQLNRPSRDTNRDSSTAELVIVKFDLGTGMIVGFKRVSDGSLLNITQKFGYYFPANTLARPGAYIFRPNTSEPYLFEKPIKYKMFKRKNGSFIEIHQKWADWLWQTIRVDAKKNYIEFDYVVGPIPVNKKVLGVEVVTRYITNMVNNGIFLTDSNDRQLLPRHRLRTNFSEQLGGSFFPVVSTIMLRSTESANNNNNSSSCARTTSGKCPAEVVAILVDRAQAGTSLNEGQLELLIHRRHLRDDNFGVDEPLDELGEDGRGLVIRGKHKVYIKFHENQQTSDEFTGTKAQPKVQLFKLPQSAKANLDFEKNLYIEKSSQLHLDPLNLLMIKQQESTTSANSKQNKYQIPPISSTATYLVHDPILNDVNQESKKQIAKPMLTFDRLRVGAHEFVNMIASNTDGAKLKTDLTLLNNSLPNNIHILTLQPWTSGNNQILMRLENLDNPLTVHPFPDYESYQNLLKTYKSIGEVNTVDSEDLCQEALRPRTEVDLEYIIKRIRIVELEELSLGANNKLSDVKRLDWSDEELDRSSCEAGSKSTSIKLAPRQIRTFLAKFTYL